MGDIYRSTMIVELNGVATANVMYWNEVTAGSGGDPEAQLNSLLSDSANVGSWAEKWADFASEEAQLTCCKIQKVDPTPTGTLKIFFDTNPGAVVGDCCPSNVAAVMRHYSAVATKRGRGRTFLAGVPESSTEEGRLTTAALTDLVELCNVVSTGMGDAVNGQWQGALYSKLDAVYRDIITSQPDSIPRMQIDRTTDLCAP